jgi:transposase-like protein
MDEDRQCMLVIIGADEWSNKDVLGLIDGFRESTQSWRELMLDLKRRGLEVAPKLAVGDGAMGFWAALHEVYGKTRVQRCWVHKTANVLNAMPKSVQPKAKPHLKDICPFGHEGMPCRVIDGRNQGCPRHRIRLLRRSLRCEI